MSLKKSMALEIKQRGFTLVEMMIVAPIVILLIGTVVATIVTLTGDSLAEGGQSQLISDVQDGLDRIEEDVRSSGAFLSTNNFNLTTPQGSDDATQKFVSISSSGQDTLILNTFVTTSNPISATRSLVYIANTPFSCTDDSLPQNHVMTMNVIYFVNNSTLWRRTLAPSGYTSKDCSGVTPWQRPSCAASKMSLNTTLCQAQDEQILSNVNPGDFSVLYFFGSSDITGGANTENTDPDVRQTALDQADTIQVTLKGTRTVGGRSISQQGTVRVSRAGSLIKYANP